MSVLLRVLMIFLNEVLSLNAQESYVRAITRPYDFPQ